VFLNISEAEGGVRTWFNVALRLLNVGTMPALPGTTDVLSAPDYEGAKAALDIVIEYRPRWAEPYYHRGLAFVGLAKGVWSNPSTGLALQDFGKALNLDPRFADVYCARADLYKKAHPQRAIADLSTLLTIEPTVAAYLKRAALSLATGQKAAAVADYREALKRYTAYCGVAECQQIETYMARVALELQEHNLSGVLNSLVTFWKQHEFTSYQ
jgi:tetratricopeptide (TPR) repeat protein